jgi:vitamin B12 transporter
LKGGQSTLYGSDAVAGVIQYHIQKIASKNLMFTGNLAAGSYGEFKQNIGFNGRQKKVKLLFDYTHLGSKGFSAAYE